MCDGVLGHDLTLVVLCQVPVLVSLEANNSTINNTHNASIYMDLRAQFTLQENLFCSAHAMQAKSHWVA